MKFLIDMNLSPLWVSFLAEKGFESVHWSTVGHPGAADSEIFDFAAANDWIVFTHDLDFGMLLAALGTSTPSVIQFKYVPRTFYRPPLEIACSAQSRPPNHTSKLALSLP
jgi:predicted nuclease of predicted toxin-antitoxin system